MERIRTIEEEIEDNFTHCVSLEELKNKINEIANSKIGMIVLETIGYLRCPPIIYQNDFQAFIDKKENFILIDHSEEVGNFQFSTSIVRNVILDKCGGYFLVRFVNDSMEVMISYHDYEF